MNRIKNILLNFLLLAVFLIPQSIQNYHFLTVHHYVSHCDESCSHLGNHFHKATDHCPIHDYVFSFSDDVFIFSEYSAILEFCEIFPAEYKKEYKQNPTISYFGRAPPRI